MACEVVAVEDRDMDLAGLFGRGKGKRPQEEQEEAHKEPAGYKSKPLGKSGHGVSPSEEKSDL